MKYKFRFKNVIFDMHIVLQELYNKNLKNEIKLVTSSII